MRPKESFFSRIRAFTVDYYDEDTDGSVLSRRWSVGAGMDGRWNSFFRFELNWDDVRAGDELFPRFRPYMILQSSPGRILNQFSLEAYLGDEIDFDNARKGDGTTLIGSFTVRPSNHLEFRANASGRWLDVDDPTLGSGRLFTAEVERLRATTRSAHAHSSA